MENLYFPLFLVAVAVVVIWLYQKSKNAGDRRAKLRKQRSARAGSRVGYTAATGVSTSDKMWSARRQHARHEIDPRNRDGGQPHTIQADYLGPYGTKSSVGESRSKVGEQGVDEVEYVGLDEYIAAERARAEARKAKEEKELTMTAVKYEPTEAAENDDTPQPRQAGFKP